MEKPIITITSKNFLTGIAPSAHIDNAGLFLKALGVTPIYDPGGTESVENGLLQAGPSPTDFTGSVIVDTIFASSANYLSSGTPVLFLYGEGGHIYTKQAGAVVPVDQRSATPVTTASNGIIVFNNTLLYFRRQNIGTWDLSGSYPTGWNDAAHTGLQTNLNHPVHRYYDRVYYGNGAFVGKVSYSSGLVYDDSNLDLPIGSTCVALSDDGVYLVIAITDNLVGSDNFGNTRILFWDTNTSSWQREYPISDPFVVSMENIGNGVIRVIGQYGIFDVIFGVGVKKVESRLTGFGTSTDLASGYGSGRAGPFGGAAIIFGTDASIDTYGKLSPELPAAYFKPFKLPAGVGRPTMVNTEFDKGRVYVATTSSKLYAYDFDAATRLTGVSAQTIYFALPEPFDIDRIDVILGEPMSSGDAFDIDTKRDEDTAAVDFDAMSFATDGAIRRKSMFPDTSVEVDNQLSLVFNWTGGNVKIKTIEVYGKPRDPVTS